jgi:hypothetical protein
MPKSKTKKDIHNLTHPLLSAMACLTNGYINNPLHKTCQQCPIGLSLHLGSSISLQFGNQPVKQFLISLISLKAVDVDYTSRPSKWLLMGASPARTKPTALPTLSIIKTRYAAWKDLS